MQIGTSTPDNLLAGDFPRVTDWLNIPSGKLKRGTVVTAAGAAMPTGGTPHGILAEDADASGGAVKAPVYLTGEFAARHLILGITSPAVVPDTLVAADIANLRKLSIFAKDTVPAA